MSLSQVAQICRQIAVFKLTNFHFGPLHFSFSIFHSAFCIFHLPSDIFISPTNMRIIPRRAERMCEKMFPHTSNPILWHYSSLINISGVQGERFDESPRFNVSPGFMCVTRHYKWVLLSPGWGLPGARGQVWV